VSGRPNDARDVIPDVASPMSERTKTMNRSLSLLLGVLLGAAAGSLAACAGERIPPKALLDARADCQRAREGIAMQLDPTDVHEADLALQRAEKAWLDNPDDPSTVDVALIADRRALLAKTEADVLRAQIAAQNAKTTAQATQANQLQNAQTQLQQTRQTLGVAEQQLQQSQVDQAAQQRKLQDLEARLKDARDTIAKIATVKDDARGMVITLQGEVLFQTGKYDLKPAAMAKLDQIAQALHDKDQPITVYGYTDTVGTRDHNMVLSQNRAQAVRDYLATKGIPPDLLSAQGKGPDEPVADNTSIEGRAQNRRVEIVVAPKTETLVAPKTP
jgi:outer membrane protein OmpA-like peptidoglycan-associated protein